MLFSNRQILYASYIIKTWKSLLECHLSAPNITLANKTNITISRTTRMIHVVTSPHQTSSQNLILDPSPGSSLVWLNKTRHSLLIYFQSSTQCDPVVSLERHPPHIEPYLASNTFLHHTSHSCAKHHNHFPNNAQLNILKFRIPRPPSKMGVHILDQLTR